MHGTFSLAELVTNYIGAHKSNKLNAEKSIRFSLLETFTRQKEINNLWRACNRRNLHPVATTFLGKITSITLNS